MIVPGSLVTARFDVQLWNVAGDIRNVGDRGDVLIRGLLAIVIAKVNVDYYVLDRVLLLTSQGYFGWCSIDHLDEVT